MFLKHIFSIASPDDSPLNFPPITLSNSQSYLKTGRFFWAIFFFLIHKILFKRKGSAVPLSSRKLPQHHKYHKQWYFINKKNLLFDDFCFFFDSQVCSEDQHNPDTINDPTFFLKHLLDNWQTHVESPNGYAVFCAIQMVTVVVVEPMLLWKLLRINWVIAKPIVTKTARNVSHQLNRTPIYESTEKHTRQ